MKYQSIIEARGSVEFPPFMAEKVYMREFYKGKLPEDLKRWGDVVDSMLDGVDTDGPIYIMIDEGIIEAGSAHRRRGLHVDGYWNPGKSVWDTGERPGWGGKETVLGAHGGGHLPSGGSGHGGGSGGHRSNSDLYDRLILDRITPSKKKGIVKKKKKLSSWDDATFDAPEALLLVSSLSAARGYVGEFEGPILEGGDCSKVDLSNLDLLNMEANRIYVGNASCLHESIPVTEKCQRQLVRLNTPGWTI